MDTQISTEQKAQTFLEEVKGFKVTDAATYRRGDELVGQAQALEDEIHASFDPTIEKQKEALKKQKEALDTAKASMEKHLNPVLMVKAAIKNAMLGWKRNEDEKARKEQARLQAIADEKARKEREKLAAKAEKAGDPEKAAEVRAAPVIVPQVSVRPAAPKTANMTTKTIWKFRIVNAALVPEAYKLVNESAVGAIVRQLKDKHGIPGVEAYPETIAADK